MGTYNSNLLPRVLMESSLEKFNAYVLIPHSTREWNVGTWNNSFSVKNISVLVEEFVKEKKNIDTDNIIIAGHSSGGIGAIYMAMNMDQMTYQFSKLVVVSGYPVSGMNSINIPTRGYFGIGESSSFMESISTLEEVISVQADHAGAPKAAYNLDEDGNGCSDLIEWMFDGYTGSTKKIDFFDEDITFEREYISDGETMPYALYTPSTASDNVAMPLIVWLHGLGEFNCSQSTFFNSRFA